MAAEMVEAGADIIQYPAVGSLPGFTPEYCGKIIDAVHEAGALAMAGIHNSQEGADIETVKRIAIDNKIIGSDMYTIGDYIQLLAELRRVELYHQPWQI